MVREVDSVSDSHLMSSMQSHTVFGDLPFEYLKME